MITAILAILLFFVMIFPHELGHYIAAKKCDVEVKEFAFGMGPVIWKRQKGETLQSIRLFPIGGFCAMEGEDGSTEEDSAAENKPRNPRAFNNKKPWQKIIILAAGSAMNVLCAFLIMSLIVGITGFPTTEVKKVTEGSPAATAQLQAGDKILEIDGTPIKEWSEVVSILQKSQGKTMTFTVERQKEKVSISVTPEMRELTAEDGTLVKSYAVGISCRVSHNPFKSVVVGAQSTWNMGKVMFTAIKQIFTGQVSTEELAGPVGVVSMVNQSIDKGVWYYGFLTAMICLNLALINMLPLPALDGGRIIFVIYSWITGRPVSAKVEGVVHTVGIVLLMGLMLYVTKNDIVRLLG